MREDSPARIHAGETNGNVILEQTQPDPPSGCEPHDRLSVNATGAPALRDPELRLPPCIDE